MPAHVNASRAENRFQRHALHGETMGTRYSVVFYTRETPDLAVLSSALFAAVHRVDQQMSNWKPDSDLNRLNAAAPGVWVTLPPELMHVLNTATSIFQRSGGAFDITIGEQVAAWGFGAHANMKGLPCLASQPLRPSAYAVELDGALRHARRLRPVLLDLSGIAKGFGVDELGRVMARFGITSWLAGIDGEMRAKGSKPDGTPWIIAHERPVPGIREAMGVIELVDLAIATSGTYRHYRRSDGRIISHTIDPFSGKPVANAAASVTVFAESCIEADGWATAFLVMGAEKALPLARAMAMDAIFVLEDDSVRSTF